MFSNKEYLKIMFVMSCAYGTMISVLSTLDQCLNSLGFEKPGRITSLIILPAMLVGIVSTIIVSIFLKKTMAYKKFGFVRNFWINLVLVGAFFGLGGLFFLLISDQDPS